MIINAGLGGIYVTFFKAQEISDGMFGTGPSPFIVRKCNHFCNKKQTENKH